MNEQRRRQNNGRDYDSASIVFLFVIPANPVNISFQLMKKDATKIMVGILTALQYYLQYAEQHIIYFQ